MKVRRQTKLYPCTRCAELILHDDMHKHVLFRCPERVSKERLLRTGRTYEPKAGR